MHSQLFMPHPCARVLRKALIATLGLIFCLSCSVGAQTVLTFHYLSEYNHQPLPCPNLWGIGGDIGGLTPFVSVGHAPSQYLYFAYNIYEDGVFHNYQVRWEVDTAGVVHNVTNPAEYFTATSDGHVANIELRDPGCSDPNEVPFMSASMPYYFVQQACDDASPSTYSIPVRVYCLGATSGGDYLKQCDRKDGGDQCTNCGSKAMARYSAHAMLASLNIEDTPVGYTPPRGPAVNFTVTYNQRDDQQPQTFTYSNLGPKWTFNWLSYVTDNPNDLSGNVSVYVRGGGTERYSGFDVGSQSYLPDPQSHAVLVRTAPAAYEKRLPDGSKQVFAQSDGSAAYPRKIFMTQVIDPAGNPITIGYDTSLLRITTLTDTINPPTTISYEVPGDPLKISKVTDPFGRFALFNYTDGKLTMITDPAQIQSQFHYTTGTTFIDSLTTPYGTTNFRMGESGTNKWIEMTDALGTERVEYRDNAPGISASEAVAPVGMTNSGLAAANTFYWDKKAIEMYPPDPNGNYDYTKARIIHWAYNSDGTVSGIVASEKAPLENRVWNAYAAQSDTNHTGPSANPSQIARILGNGSTQSSLYEYNSIGKVTKATDPAGRVTSYVYDANNIDLLTVYQRNPAGQSMDPSGAAADIIERHGPYNSLHESLTDTDAAGQVTTFTYNTNGQILTRENAKHEITTYGYGDGTTGHPIGYLTSITSPPYNNASAVTSFTYDSANRVRTVTNEADAYTVTTDYDDLDRPTQMTYPDGTTIQLKYTKYVNGVDTGEKRLDLGASKDRRGLWTYREYDANRHLTKISDPQNRTTTFGWCSCGQLATITDPKTQITTFNRDLQGRVYQKLFNDNTAINYLYDGQTVAQGVGASSRLQSATDAKNQRTNYTYFADDSIQQITYTDTSGQPLNPPTPTVSFTPDPNYNRVQTMIDGTGQTTYAYKPVTVSPPTLGANQLNTIDGPLTSDLITFNYDELGRVINRKINGTANSQTWAFDSLGRLSNNTNKLGTFTYAYVGVTDRLDTLTYPGGGYNAHYSYFDNLEDRHLQQIKNQTSAGSLLSQFDYTYDDAGQIKTWTKNNPGLSAPQRYDLTYDNADQMTKAPLKNALTNTLITNYQYGYDLAANRTVEKIGGATTNSTPNSVNEIWLQSGGTNRTLLYDANGSLTDDGLTRTFEWDAANRLVAINTGTTNRSEFTYDGLSRCVKIVEKTNGSVISTRKFVWCGMEKCEFRDAGDVVTDLIYPQGQYSGTIKYFYFRDHLGSIREMMRSNGTVVARFDYDPWGRSTAVLNTTLPDFNYTGLYRHSPSNLDMAVHRFYDPDLGRWLSRDPIAEAGGTNLFAYVRNNPANAVDPFGLKTCWKNVIMTTFGDLPTDKIGTRDNILRPNDIAVGHYGTTQFPKRTDAWVLPYGTAATVYPRGEQPYLGTVADVGAYDKKHPDLAGPADWIDRWNPALSKRGFTSEGWISVEVGDCEPCPLGYKDFIDGHPPLLPPGLA
jgi:RHS repeat-associated protein